MVPKLTVWTMATSSSLTSWLSELDAEPRSMSSIADDLKEEKLMHCCSIKGFSDDDRLLRLQLKARVLTWARTK